MMLLHFKPKPSFGSAWVTGNITSMSVFEYTDEGVTPTGGITYTYGYTNSAWGDQLTSYRGQTITYDAIGNPLTYYNGQNYLFTWEGRRLVSASTGYNFNSTYTYTYNDEGLRTSKTINGVTTTYTYYGNLLISEEKGGNVTIYLYDASGSPIGMQYHSIYHAEDEWDVYWYEKNLQGDVVAVYDSDGTIHIEYNYTAWGYCTYTDYENSSAINNPFRYRGYYFDDGLNLYYLGSRYYDQNTGRFINADSYVSTGTGLLGYNMYAYCNNNPVMMVDSSGKGPISILALVLLVGVTIITLTSCGSSESDELSYNYAATENDVVDDKINYRIDPGASDGSTEPQIVIYNSYNYTSRSEQKRILKYIIDTDRAQETGLSSDDIDYYIKEWSVHNYAYYHPSLAAMVKGCSVDSAKESARHVNLNTDDPAAAYYEWFGGLIGVFY